MSSIAVRRGYDWRTVWEHGDNTGLRELRGHPNLLRPGDEVVIPPFERKLANGSTNQTHRFVKRGLHTLLRLKLVRNGEAVSGDYTLHVGGEERSGSLADGVLEERIRASANSAELVLHERREKLTLRLGHLDPADTPSGALDRMRNLGWITQTELERGELTSDIRALLRLLQEDAGLVVSGALDAETASLLVEKYGC